MMMSTDVNPKPNPPKQLVGVNATKPNPRLVTRLSAVAKYPYVVASEHSVKFGDVIVGCDDEFQIRREFVVRNQSVVPAAFKLLRVEALEDDICIEYLLPGEDEPLP